MRIHALLLAVVCLAVVPSRSWAGDGIHPLTGPAWSFETHQAGAELSFVRAAGDVNGDGFGDVIASAPSFDTSSADAGRAWLFLGSASGLSTTPAWQSSGPDQAGARFGSSVATAGDVDGDGFDDVLITASGFDAPQVDAGLVQLYRGGPNGLATSPSWSFVGTQAGMQIKSAAYAGDLNHDGFDDVVVGAIDPSSAGHVFLFFGRATGLTAAPNWTVDGTQLGLGTGAELGSAVACAGDVNADGFDDFLVGAALAPDPAQATGRVMLFLGRATAPLTSPAWTASGASGDAFGAEDDMGRAGDVNGDGFADVVIGAGGAGADDHGEVRVYLGNASGLSSTPIVLSGTQGFARFGAGASAAGDVNGDGFADVWIGAPFSINALGSVGRVELHLGTAGGIGIVAAQAFAGSDIGATAGGQAGASVSTLGDVDGDGFADVVVVAPHFDGAQVDEGKAWSFAGAPRGIPTSPSWLVQYNDSFGVSVDGAGDVDGDGFSDLVVGSSSPIYLAGGLVRVFRGSSSGLQTTPAWTLTAMTSAGSFGASVAGAGDVNGDGYGDVIVGDPYYSNGQNYEGAAFLYLGGPSGLTNTPAWRIEADQPSAALGATIASAGDVNGDGFTDVIVCAPGFDLPGLTDAGRLLVFYGSSTGLPTTPSWVREGTHAGEHVGRHACAAGDVNGDGFGDLIAVSQLQAALVRVEIFFGSAHGLSSTPAWSDDVQSFGYARPASGAGDVNGDGFDDVIVSGPPTQVFLGGPSGPGPLPAWYANVLGRLNAAGDLDGDGYSDVVVTEYDSWYQGMPYLIGEGWVFRGNAGGLDAAPHWHLAGTDLFPLADVNFGYSAGCAGDVNGDGISDLFISAPEVECKDGCGLGRVMVFQGNYGGGPALVPQQVRANDLAPIAPLGRSEVTTGFRIHASPHAAAGSASTVAGRRDVKLEREVKEQHVPFDATGVITSTSAHDTGPIGTQLVLDELSTGLTQGRTYHWRARFTSNDPVFAHTRWVGAPVLSIASTMLRTFRDCNGNAVPDESDIANGTSSDTNGDGLPDECQGSVGGYCFGDGSATPCPCGNPGASGHGCANSANAAGARLAASGVPSAAHDSLVLHGVGMTPTSSVLYFQGTLGVAGGAGAPFGDGLRCVGGSVVRLGVEHNAGGVSTYPGAASDASISVKGAIPVGGGVTRRYQAWFRDAAAFCTSAAFNLTNGLAVVWAP